MISDCLLGKIVIDDEGVLAIVTEVFTHGTARKKGARYCRGAASEALAETTMVYFMAPAIVRRLTSWATVDLF